MATEAVNSSSLPRGLQEASQRPQAAPEESSVREVFQALFDKFFSGDTDISGNIFDLLNRPVTQPRDPSSSSDSVGSRINVDDSDSASELTENTSAFSNASSQASQFSQDSQAGRSAAKSETAQNLSSRSDNDAGRSAEQNLISGSKEASELTPEEAELVKKATATEKPVQQSAKANSEAVRAEIKPAIASESAQMAETAKHAANAAQTEEVSIKETGVKGLARAAMVSQNQATASSHSQANSVPLEAVPVEASNVTVADAKVFSGENFNVYNVKTASQALGLTPMQILSGNYSGSFSGNHSGQSGAEAGFKGFTPLAWGLNFGTSKGVFKHGLDLLHKLPQSQQAKIITRIQDMLKAASENKSPSSMVVRLDPPSLGQVTLKVMQRGDRLYARIIPESQEVETLLRTRAVELMNVLTNSGIRADHLHVSIGAELADSEAFQFAGQQELNQNQNQHEGQDESQHAESADSVNLSTEIPEVEVPDVVTDGWVA